MDIKKLICAFIYIFLSICNGFSRWYVNKFNIATPAYYTLFPYCACILPYLTYKINFKSKWFFYIFLQFFSLVYVYIFLSKNVVYFHTSLITFTDLLLRYHIFWKYIVYNTIETKDTKSFHLYATCSYFAYHIHYQIDRLMKLVSFDPNYVFYGCCISYILIGFFGFMTYNVEEKHILMHDLLNKKRAFIKAFCVYFSECIMLIVLKQYSPYVHMHFATIIGSSLILTLNGQLLKTFNYDKLRYVSSVLSLLTILGMNFATIYKDYIIRAGIALITGSKLIIFDSLHQVLHITHKKNVIDRYIGIEIIFMSLAYVTVYYISQQYLFYYSIFCCVCLFAFQIQTLKYYNKDVEFLECISQLDEF